MKFEFINFNCHCILYKRNSKHLITFGNSHQIVLFKNGYNHLSYCAQSNTIVNYHGIKHALIGTTNPNHFTLQRIVVFQME